MKKLLFALLLTSSYSLQAQTQTVFAPGGTLGTSSNGNVGIGISTPAEALQINGSIRGSDAAGAYNGALNVKTQYGSLQLGAQNSTWAHIYTDRTAVIFNKTVYSYDGTFSSYSTNPLSLQIQGSTKLTILNNGMVGIGTSSPAENLSVNGTANAAIRLTSSGNAIGNAGLSLAIASAAGSWNNVATAGDAVVMSRLGGSEDLILGTANVSNGSIRFTTTTNGSGDIERMTINNNGSVSVGSFFKVNSINGITYAKEINVTTNAFPDYVFAKGYKLRSLSDLNDYILTNKHLPNIPVAAEIEKNGMPVGDLQVRMMEKIEELTLYVIQQNQEIKDLQTKVKEMSIK